MANEIFKSGLIELAGQFETKEGTVLGNFIIADTIRILLDLVDEFKEDLEDGRMSWFEVLGKLDNTVEIGQLVAKYKDYEPDAVALATDESYQNIVLERIISRVGTLFDDDKNAKLANHAVKSIVHGVYFVIGYINANN